MSESVRSYKDLVVWQQARVLVRECYKLTGSYPKSELFGLTAQIRTSSVSVQANIAEDSGRGTTKEYLYFLRNARGSLTELESYTIIVVDLGFSTDEQVKPIQELIASTGRLLSALITSLEKKDNQQSRKSGPPPPLSHPSH